MLYVKINDLFYPATIITNDRDREWNSKQDKEIHLEMSLETARALFVDDLIWSTVELDESTGEPIPDTEVDCSDYCIVGPITDYRNGKVCVRMGKLTDHELLEIITGNVE